MKILLVSKDVKSKAQLRSYFESRGHVMVAEIDDPNLLPHHIARTTPHIVLMHGLTALPTGHLVVEHLQVVFPDITFDSLIARKLDETTGWVTTVENLLERPLPYRQPRPYADDTRIVAHDDTLFAFWKGKLGRPKQEDGWQATCAQQEARFILQLQAAAKNHSAAKHYYLCLASQQFGLDTELTYRLVHSSYKALSWTRELCFQWIGLLAHYVSDAELEYLPFPGAPGALIDYVHHDPPIEGMYAATLLISSGIKPAVESMIQELVGTRYEGEDDETLFARSVKLYGMAKMLEQVATAQIHLFSTWLDANLAMRENIDSKSRAAARASGIYRDFYGLHYIIDDTVLLSVLKGYHTGETSVEIKRGLPSFIEFRAFCDQNSARV